VLFWTQKTTGKYASMSVQKRNPLARSEDLVVQEVEDEVLVYDELYARAHCLSADAARVWRACDGNSGADDLAGRLTLSEETVVRALAELEDKELLDQGPVLPNGNGNGRTRREFGIRAAKVGALAASAPMIYSTVIAPPMAAATPTPQQCLFYSADSCNGCTAICGCCCCCQGCSATTQPACKICFPTSLCSVANTGPGCDSLIPGAGQCSSGPNCSATAKAPPKCSPPCPTPATCNGHDCNCLGIGNPCGP
jgi:hypothetical protein